jgi:ketosteroid isomerase-like protein
MKTIIGSGKNPDEMKQNLEVVEELYRAAEADVNDIKKFVSLFADNGYFYDVSAGKKYYGKDLGNVVAIYHAAFPDMHRELDEFYVLEDMVIVQLSLNGTHKGPLELPIGTIPATGKRMKTPCADYFKMKNGKIEYFHCYTAATVLLTEIGVIGNIGAAIAAAKT